MFRRQTLLLTFTLVSIGLAGCATTLSEEDCAQVNWNEIGFVAGTSLGSDDKFHQTAKMCSDYGTIPDRAAYDAGYANGKLNFCTASGGFRAGNNGRRETVADVCPVQRRTDFLVAYDDGAKLRALRSTYESAISSRDSAISTIESCERDIYRYEENLRTLDPSSDSYHADVQKTRKKLRRAEDRARNARRDLNRYERDIDYSYRELQDYKRWLARNRNYY